MAQSTPLGNGSFAQGTRSATPSGPALVESLSPGDQVLTDAGPANLVVAASRPPAPPSVLVRAHAFGQGAPSVDLRLSTEHMIHLRDSGTAEAVLVPVGALINGASIIRLPIVAAVSWITLGVQRHALVLAEDLPVGAMRPDGSPMVARQMPPGPALFGPVELVGRRDIDRVYIGALAHGLHAGEAAPGKIPLELRPRLRARIGASDYVDARIPRQRRQHEAEGAAKACNPQTEHFLLHGRRLA